MIGFRVDANETIATGHLMRCIAIAQEFLRRGEEVLFFLAEEKETKRLKERNIPYRILHTDWRELDGEVSQLKEELKKEGISVLVVDSYQATARYLGQLEQAVPVCYVDDMAGEVYPVSYVLHYVDWMEDDGYRKAYLNQHTTVLAGMQYVPLRQEFYPAVKKDEKAILLTTGGTDPYHMTRRLVEGIRREDSLSETDIHIVAGSMNPDLDVFRQMEEKDTKIHFHYNVNCMGNLMRKCDAAVSAGGTTLFELCACKVPTICFSFADNQAGFTRKMGEHQVMLYAGDARENPAKTASVIIEKLVGLCGDKELSHNLSENMGKLVDGKGVGRIVDALLKSKEYFQ